MARHPSTSRYQRSEGTTVQGKRKHSESIFIPYFLTSFLFFKAKVKLIWPRISNASKLSFPLTQVMNTTIQRLKLYNSASHAVIVQLVMEWAYPQAKRLLDSYPQRYFLFTDHSSEVFIYRTLLFQFKATLWGTLLQFHAEGIFHIEKFSKVFRILRNSQCIPFSRRKLRGIKLCPFLTSGTLDVYRVFFSGDHILQASFSTKKLRPAFCQK